MSERLPGNLQERLRELREEHGYSRNKLADTIEVDRSRYGRIERGEIKSINSDVLLKLAKLYNVSVDYILGISNTPEKTYYDIGELGLSVEAAKNLYTGKVDARVINELLINNKFAVATKMMATYFSGAVSDLLKAQNALMDFNYDMILEYQNTGELPKDDKDIQDLKKQFKHAKVPANTYEFDRIQRQLMGAVKEIQNKITDEVSEYQKEQKVIYYDILDTVKSEAAKIPNIKDLSEEQKKEIIIKAMNTSVEKASSLSPENKARVESAISQIAPTLMDIGKEM
ncbi:Transcriptional regulator, contains XRE-family HTH domain [Pseudobutyrivibrio sp. 49]|uniref:helix-turn-helix domain-containing protein n=1 Tax=Pseudobutyrivibrio sp. 49 TaxID=1855344 RepID=UPI00088FC6DA|nr:helix-turn-helix transcriptional regulator [Pseudobutyrivibrio sp. 49]SDI52298.1 Transcriptional regulator, contains XRE-family HTH domain [Pseudobutyrivibrio sp. 49]